ncbi:MAG: cation:proton antiporter [Nanoarchaeota archaeon]|nr:cation:proton antiporter [Nanoarchaeota archaeon]
MIGVENADIFLQLGVVVIVAAIAAFLLRVLKQPQILAYVVAGILLTPVFHIVTDTSIIQSMSIIGIAFLLFLVGLEMDLKSLQSVAFISSIGGIIQIVLLFILGYTVALLLGFLSLEAGYIGLMIAFSSTMVVMKLLSDKRELQTLHGRIVVGILLVEDIIAIFALSVLSSLNEFSWGLLAVAMLKFLSLFMIAYLLSKFVFPSTFRFSAQHQELLLIMSLAVCFTFALVFQYLGFSIAIGAFIAGLALGNLQYNVEIIGKMKSLRDFFALLFFVSLGMGLSLAVIKQLWKPLVVILAVVIFIKPLITMTIFSLFRYTKKPAFLTANSLAQMGEFSLIIAAQGLVLGHLSEDIFSLVVIVALTTITLTSYFIQYEYAVYRFLRFPLRVFDIFPTKGLGTLSKEIKPTIVLCGYNRIGYSILRDLEKVRDTVLIVDYNPDIITSLAQEKHHCLYGDVADEEIVDRMNLKNITLLISTVPELKDNIYLIKRTKSVNKKARIIVTASDIDETLALYDHGADYVILPHFLGGEHGSAIISRWRKQKIDLKEEKEKHLAHLHERRMLGQKHPKH